MKELILAIIIACSLGMSGCTEDNTQSTGNKQIDDAMGIKTEEKAEEPEKKKEEEDEQELKERVSKRNIVMGNCAECDKVICRNDDYVETKDLFVCRDCYNKTKTKCMDCGKTIKAYDEEVTTGSDGCRCKDCTEAYENSLSNYSDYGDDYGDYCCEECGSELSPEEVCTQNGRILCPDCAFSEDLREQGLDHQQ